MDDKQKIVFTPEYGHLASGIQRYWLNISLPAGFEAAEIDSFYCIARDRKGNDCFLKEDNYLWKTNEPGKFRIQVHAVGAGKTQCDIHTFRLQQLIVIIANKKVLFSEREVETKFVARKGCYIATCVYGSYDCPEVWVLRRYRDAFLQKRWWGRLFIKIYYSISPWLVLLFGNKEWFRKSAKRYLNRRIMQLLAKNYTDQPYID